jgi:hypothetical protein
MSNHSDPQASPPLDADDPRLSEWIDGRLSPAEAVEVERAVRSSPALAQLVDDLRAIKAAARQVPAAAPPAGFAERVMEAVLSGGGAAAAADAAADRAVEQEWQSIETERIAEERAEAAADLVPGPAAAASGWSWPRLTIAAALAAGLLATVVLNRPEEGPREIAQLAAKPELDRLDAAARREAAPADEEATRPLAAPAAGAALPPAAAVAARSLESNGRLRESKAKADADVSDFPVVIRVASWTEFDRLLEAHGIEAKPIEAGAGDDRADESGDWTLELSGPSAGLEALLAAAGVEGLGKRQAAAGEELTRQGEAAFAAPAAKQAEEAQLRGRGPGGRLLVRLVITKPASSKPAGLVPGEGEGGDP